MDGFDTSFLFLVFPDFFWCLSTLIFVDTIWFAFYWLWCKWLINQEVICFGFFSQKNAGWKIKDGFLNLWLLLKFSNGEVIDRWVLNRRLWCEMEMDGFYVGIGWWRISRPIVRFCSKNAFGVVKIDQGIDACLFELARVMFIDVTDICIAIR